MTAAFLPLVILNGVLLALNIGPLYWQVTSGNSGAICMGFWVALANLNTFLNFAIWYRDAVNRAPVFCDISVKIRLGAEIGRLASIFCVARFLADIVSPRATALTRSDRRRRAIFDYSIAFGVPSLVMALHYVWQPARFAVVKGYGCNVTALMTWPTLVFRFIWPPLFAAAAVLYSEVYTGYRLVRHRRNFQRVVAGSHSALTTARFIRLAILSFSYLLIAMPLAVYGTIIDLSITGRYFEYSWTYIHSPWKLHSVLIEPIPPRANIGTWSDVIAGLIFFAAFGFGMEAISLYSKASAYLSKVVQRTKVDKAVPVYEGERQVLLWKEESAFQVSYDGAFRSQPKEGVKVVVQREEHIV
ncbi:BQ2448_6992 [Microbotryum intermedium]|uniref:BQ2448_6992 protein n=1 Tax=Microbotryum intermedium TaxID=269621 RepID=A0A238FIJ9_9BASI|nr:BQ2448_6992 [Microbotryum intermedium]